jgi:hypothetical protein
MSAAASGQKSFAQHRHSDGATDFEFIREENDSAGLSHRT